MKYIFTAGVFTLLLLSACTSTNQVSQPPIETTTQMTSQTAPSQLEWLTSDKTFVTLTNLKYPKGFFIKPFEGENIMGLDIDSIAGKMFLDGSKADCDPKETCTNDGLQIKINTFIVEPKKHTIEQGFLKKTSFPSIDKVDMAAFEKFLEKTADGVYSLPKEQYYFYGKNKTYEIQVWENNYKRPGTVDEIVQGVLASLKEDPTLSNETHKPGVEGFTVEFDKQKNKYVLNGGGTNYVELPIVIPKDDEIKVEVFKETPYNVFIRSCSTGMGGYIVYDMCQGDFYMFNRTNQTLTDLTQEGLILMDISSDESDATMTAWAQYVYTNHNLDKILIKNMAGKTLKTFTVNPAYTDFGDIKFSPDASKVVYAASTGNPDKESGVVMIVDLNSGKEQQVDQTDNGHFEINGWKDNNMVDYKKV